MKKIFFVALLIWVNPLLSQRLSQVSFSNGSDLSFFSFLTDQGVQIRVSEQGMIKEWGVEVKALTYDVYARALQPFPGRVEYYDASADSLSRGKVKSIGTCNILYYGAYEAAERAGKIKSIGRLQFDYFSSYENTSLKGKLKQAGDIQLDYYNSSENEMVRGKLKSIGGTPISYHSSFDDKFIRGRVKSIGTVQYAWYTSLDPGKAQGALKSGTYRQNINGITYILQ